MWPFLRGTACVLAPCVLFAACRQAPEPTVAGQPAVPALTRQPGAGDRPRIVILGDSLTAGYGLAREEAFPSILQALLEQQGYRYEVVNAGVSGDTTAGGLRRLEWSLAGDARVLVVALGGNDALRGLPPAEMKRNLEEIVRRSRARGTRVLLAGMEAPPNLGPQYTVAFRQAFRDLAREQEVSFLPFLLVGVAGDPSLNQADGIHPNAPGARAVAEHVLGALAPILDDTLRADGQTWSGTNERGAAPDRTDASRR